MSALLTSIDEEDDKDYVHFGYSVGELPTTFESAMGSTDAKEWKEACKSDFESLCKNNTWEIISPSSSFHFDFLVSSNPQPNTLEKL